MANGQGCKTQAGHPSLCLGIQLDDGSSIDVNWDELLKQQLGFFNAETQVLAANLCQPATSTQSDEGQERIHTGAQHQVQVARRMEQQLVQQIANSLCLDQVVVIQDQDEGLFDLVDFVDQQGNDGSNRGRERRLSSAWVSGIPVGKIVWIAARK